MIHTLKTISAIGRKDDVVSLNFVGGDKISLQAARTLSQQECEAAQGVANVPNTHWKFDEIDFVEGWQYKITIEKVKPADMIVFPLKSTTKP